jgi:hypothetical protein
VHATDLIMRWIQTASQVAFRGVCALVQISFSVLPGSYVSTVIWNKIPGKLHPASDKFAVNAIRKCPTAVVTALPNVSPN